MYQIPKFHPKKMAKRRRKLRSLIAEKAAETEAKNSHKFPIFIGCLMLTGMLVAAYLSDISTTMIWSDFLTSYRNQYNLVVHGGKDYCAPNIDTAKLFSKIRQKVINQEAALSNIEMKFRNQSNFLALGIAGTSGIGKSLFVQELGVNFPWRENVQTYSWSLVSTDVDGKQEVQTFTKYLSECGKNLIVIDNLGSRDVDFIQDYNKRLSEYVREQDSVKLVAIYVFNLFTYTKEQTEAYNKTLKDLELALETMEIVEFRKFNSDDVKDCIRNEVSQLNVTLDDGITEEISKLIVADRSGCKNVYSKVRMYGKGKNL